MKRQLSLTLSLIFLVLSFSANSAELDESGSASVNVCYDRFMRHSKYSAQALRRYGLCSQRYSYTPSRYGDVSWADYFKCFDRVGPFLEGKMTYYTQCSKRRYNRFANSEDPGKCQAKLRSFEPKVTTYPCFLEDYAERVLDSDYDQCFADARQEGQELFDSLNLCFRSNWEEKLSCVKKLTPLFGASGAKERCEKREHLDAVSDNGFEGCMQDMSALELSLELSFDICSSDEPDDTMECVNENKTGLAPSEQAKRCLGKNYREANDSRHFTSCIDQAVHDGFSKREAIDVCAQDEDSTKLIAKDDDFRKCAKSAIEQVGISKPKAYATCKEKDVRKKILEPAFQSCLKKGLRSGLYGYFTLENDAVEDLSKDCLSGDSEPEALENMYGISLFADYNIHTKAKATLDNSEIGGLSAVRFKGDKLYLLSDDKGFNGRPRAYVYSVGLQENGISLKEESVIHLQTNKKKGGGIDVDPEGLDVLPNGALLISSEVEDVKSSSPLGLYGPSGNQIKGIEMPAAFESKKNKRNVYSAGMRPNKGIESLSLSPSSSSLFLASEGALTQDRRLNKVYEVDKNGRRKTTKAGDLTRIVQYELINGEFAEKAQYFYRLEDEEENGVSEVLSISEKDLLVLERSWDSRKKKITARIYHVEVDDANNILPEPKNGHILARANELALKKTLILDLDDIVPQLSPGFKSLENFEGLAIGPKLPSGKESLVLVSDNNFSRGQRSVLLILEADLNKIIEDK